VRVALRDGWTAGKRFAMAGLGRRGWWVVWLLGGLVVLSGCKVGSSAGDPASGQTDNGAIPKNSISGTVVFSCDFGVYDTAKASVGYTLAVR
jgi:hypothetical protein